MTNGRLFLEMLHRLKRYDDACVLYQLLMQWADKKEAKLSTTMIAFDFLAGQINAQQVRRALHRLQELGLIAVRTHANYRTLVTVDRQALTLFLGTPAASGLPGLQAETFPFLDDMNAVDDAAKNDAAKAIKKARKQPGTGDAPKPDGT